MNTFKEGEQVFTVTHIHPSIQNKIARMWNEDDVVHGFDSLFTYDQPTYEYLKDKTNILFISGGSCTEGYQVCIIDNRGPNWVLKPEDHELPKEHDQYKLFTDKYNYTLLTVSYVESNVVWMHCHNALPNSDSCYKYDRKTERLYKWCGDGYDRVDTEYGFSKLSSEDTAQALWEARKQPLVDYSGFYGD